CSKSARVGGDVLARLRPHGDQSIYDALVRMAQPFSMGLLLVDGQGNFGSVDNDPPAAMRYTECRLTKAAMSILADLDKDTVDFKDNYDGPEVSLETLLDIVPGPDFPTGGQIIGRTAARTALMTGRGSVIMRGVATIEEIRKEREAIVIHLIPYQLNKAGLVERIAELVREKRVEGIADLRDESDRQGMRIVIEMKRDASPDVILNQLYRFTPLQTSFGVNMLALNRGRPEQMGLSEMIRAFVDFREEVVVRRVKFE